MSSNLPKRRVHQVPKDRQFKKSEVAGEIIKARQDAKMTQVDLARETQTTRSAISRYESGRYDSYSVPLLRRIAKACNTDLQVKFIPKATKAK